MNLKKIILTIALLSNATFIKPYHQELTILLYTESNHRHKDLEKALFKFNIKFQITNILEKNDTCLYIIPNAFDIASHKLPKYFITYQTLDLENNLLTEDYLQTLAHSIAVWDYSWKNIEVYRSKIHNYYYMPSEYEYSDPVVLPCFLPISVLDAYKELLIYSNRDNTEISSLIPVLFFHSFIQKPKLIAEVGVCLGYSTRAFQAVNLLCESTLLGIDNDPNAVPAYSNIYNSIFLLINDLNFHDYYKSSNFKEIPLDIVFIDTSHEYEHTLLEIKLFEPLLSKNGIIMFHDSYVTPLTVEGRPAFWRLNNTIQKASVNPIGVAPAIKNYFGISFDESQYTNAIFNHNNRKWQLIHYPFCNGLTILKRI